MKQNLLRISGAAVDFDKSVLSCFKAHRKQMVFKDTFKKWEIILTWYYTLPLYFTCCKKEQTGKISRAYLPGTETQPRAAGWWLWEGSADEVHGDSQGATAATPTQVCSGGFAASPHLRISFAAL